MTRPQNPYKEQCNRGNHYCEVDFQEWKCLAHEAWEEGYAAAQPTWTRVDLERPETFPPGWVRAGDTISRTKKNGRAVLCFDAESLVHRYGSVPVNTLWAGQWWHPLPAPPKEES